MYRAFTRGALKTLLAKVSTRGGGAGCPVQFFNLFRNSRDQRVVCVHMESRWTGRLRRGIVWRVSFTAQNNSSPPWSLIFAGWTYVYR